ncbi:hypothetical protein LCGC14_1457200, partial [marine sediment metagenome]
MNKLIRLSKTGIEYADYAWNFASGCGNNINGKCKAGGFKCWAYSISQRFEGHYPNGFEPTIYPDALCSPLYLKKPSRILCAFMGDLFWDCPEFNPEGKIRAILPSQIASIMMSLKGWLFTTIRQCPQHTFIFLTKQPQNLAKFSPFPDNCWVGVTATDHHSFAVALNYLWDLKATTKYISFEPLLGQIPSTPRLFLASNANISWLIIGAQTKPTVFPKIEWVREIVEAADKA